MHLLEAFLCCASAHLPAVAERGQAAAATTDSKINMPGTSTDSYLEEAGRIVELFFSVLFDECNGCVGEFFDDDWGADAAQGQNVEPGHSFEWVWLLHE